MSAQEPPPAAPGSGNADGRDGINRALVEACIAGDRQAREDLGEQVGRQSFVFAVQLTGNRETAMDVAQDGVVRFFNSLDRFDPSRPVEPWLYQIVRNRVRDLARRDRHRRQDSLDALLADGRPEASLVDQGTAPDAAAEAERGELQRRIWSAVSQLSEAHREIFVLRDFHGLSYEEIADVLSVPKGTVMSRLHNARTNLRRLMAERNDR